jgi:hypothetical protein
VITSTSKLQLRHARRERGAVAIITAIVLPVLIGFAGLALDLGRLFVEKTELQNATDACALAAARELTCDPTAGACAASLLVNAENSGMFVAARNSAQFQGTPVAIAAEDIRFSTTFGPNSSYVSRAAGADPASKYVMCTAQQTGILPWFMQVLGAGAQTVSAQAVATLMPSQSNCGIPLGMCAQGPATASPPFGLVRGNWYDGRFNSGGGATGSFNWIDYTPPAGGQAELSALLTGSGVCNTTVPNPVGQSGVLGNAAARAWNSRFGLYQGGPINVDTAPPDFTGYSYTPTNWPTQRNALGDFLARRAANASYGANVDAGNTTTGLGISNAYNPTTTPAQHAARGADRRLVVAPIMNCADWAAANVAPIQGYACVLMLHPIASPSDIVYMEYLGLSNEPNSPCATSGVVGGATSSGPLVPALVQ